MLNEIKNYAKKLWIPIILDDSLDLVKAILNYKKPKKILEIGTAVGYSSICFSQFLDDNGSIDTVEIDGQFALIAKANIEMMGLKDKINVIEGDAKDILHTLKGKYDFIFVDGPKSHYIEYLPICLSLLNPNGIIIADNVIYKGMVPGIEKVKHKQRTAVTKLREFIHTVKIDKKLISSLINVGDGILLISKIDN